MLPVRVTLLDTEKLGEGLAEELRAVLEEKVAAATRAAEIYENGAYRPELLQSAFSERLNARLQTSGACLRERDVRLRLRYVEKAWQLEDPEELRQALLDGADADAAAVATTSVVPSSASTLPSRTSAKRQMPVWTLSWSTPQARPSRQPYCKSAA